MPAFAACIEEPECLLCNREGKIKKVWLAIKLVDEASLSPECALAAKMSRFLFKGWDTLPTQDGSDDTENEPALGMPWIDSSALPELQLVWQAVAGQVIPLLGKISRGKQ